MKIIINEEDLIASTRYDYVCLLKQYMRDQVNLLTELGLLIHRADIWFSEDRSVYVIASNRFVRIARDFVEIV